MPRTNPDHPPAVWAIDAEHAPLYWFPATARVSRSGRDSQSATAEFRRDLRHRGTPRDAIELGWLEQVRSTGLHRYEFDASEFAPWQPASGQWIADHAVEPLSITPVGDLLQAHATAGIELRLVPSLWPLRELAWVIWPRVIDGTSAWSGWQTPSREVSPSRPPRNSR